MSAVLVGVVLFFSGSSAELFVLAIFYDHGGKKECWMLGSTEEIPSSGRRPLKCGKFLTFKFD
jgi:hypothetical protein